MLQVAKKQNNSDKSLVMSKEYFSGFTKMSLDLIHNGFYGYDILFLIADIAEDGNFQSKRLFFVEEKRIPNTTFRYKWYWDNEVRISSIKSLTGETQDEYNHRIDELKKMIRNEIKSGRLYARRI